MYFIKKNKKFEFELRRYVTNNNIFLGNLIYPKNYWLGFDFPAFLQNADFSIIRFKINPYTGIMQEVEEIALDNNYKEEGYFVNIPLNLTEGFWYIKADLSGEIYKSFNIIKVENIEL